MYLRGNSIGTDDDDDDDDDGRRRRQHDTRFRPRPTYVQLKKLDIYD